VPYFQRLVDLLVAAPHRVQPDGTIDLSATEAAMLRACDFLTAAPGPWPIPPLSAHVPVSTSTYLFRILPHLARATATVTPSQGLAVVPAPAVRSTGDSASTKPLRPSAHFAAIPPLPPRVSEAPPPAQQCDTPAPAPTPTPTVIAAPVTSRYRGVPVPLSARLSAACANGVQHRILQSVAKRPDGQCRKRQLQQRLHRIPANDLNAALDRLIAAGLILRDGRWLSLDAEARRLLTEAGIGVSRRRRARATRQSGERHHAARGPVRSERVHVGQPGQRRYKRRPIPNRQKDPHGWALSMRGRLGGLWAQRSYRARGVPPTDKATRVRLAKQGLSRTTMPSYTNPRHLNPLPPTTTQPAATRLRTAADVWYPDRRRW
jgi:hypothetical protein